ncbi:hypothetical protein F9B85_05305 [Heliorestis acidaminivorans]|uniref:Uncharacterized protein n=1 Tax=Heliorestis acidaminivorans TaxID=553427 RepID=A0A6I0ES54_9FIRM|nr:hypothetical protein [Heliorestis acidaminivorans]KAB2953330.1 hypothetical protein F9B85_05305 [Heliorestis acidaminivorans]
MTGARLIATRFCSECNKNAKVNLAQFLGSTMEEIIKQAKETELYVPSVHCCGQEALATHFELFVGKQIVFLMKIQNKGFQFFDQTIDEKDDEQSRKKDFPTLMQEQDDHWKHRSTRFWDGFYHFCQKQWDGVLEEMVNHEIAIGLAAVGFDFDELEGLSQASMLQFAKDLPQDEHQIFFVAANKFLVNTLQHDLCKSWNSVKKYQKEYGKTRTNYILLHIPLIEEFEAMRLQAVTMLVPETIKTGSKVLFRKIQNLESELSGKRVAISNLRDQLVYERQEKDNLEEKLNRANREIRRLRQERN